MWYWDGIILFDTVTKELLMPRVCEYGVDFLTKRGSTTQDEYAHSIQSLRRKKNSLRLYTRYACGLFTDPLSASSNLPTSSKSSRPSTAFSMTSWRPGSTVPSVNRLHLR